MKVKVSGAEWDDLIDAAMQRGKEQGNANPDR